MSQTHVISGRRCRRKQHWRHSAPTRVHATTLTRPHDMTHYLTLPTHNSTWIPKLSTKFPVHPDHPNVPQFILQANWQPKPTGEKISARWQFFGNFANHPSLVKKMLVYPSSSWYTIGVYWHSSYFILTEKTRLSVFVGVCVYPSSSESKS